MAGELGKITRAKGGKQRAVYLSDAFGIWKEGDLLYLAIERGNQDLPPYPLSPNDGEIYYLLNGLWEYGMSLP